MRKRLKKIADIALIFAMLAVFAGTCPVSAGSIGEWPAGPGIKGDAAIVVDAETGSILYEKNIYDKYYPASTTKILTTLVALENSELNEIVTVSHAADKYVSATSSRMGLVEGEQLTMEQALYGIMLESANEATYAVGEHVGGSIAKFIKMMNKKAQDLGCERSHFANSHGLHDDDHYTCCYDLSLIALAAYRNEAFMKINGTATYNMPATNKHDAKLLTNHHWFLNKTMKYDYCIGGKTGSTSQAGYALVTYAKKDGMTLISVVMHAPSWTDVYNDSKNLLEYVFDTFDVYRMAKYETLSGSFPSMFEDAEMFEREGQSVISSGNGAVVILPDSILPSDLTKTIKYDTSLELKHGDNKIGEIIYSVGDRIVGSGDIMFYYDSDPVTNEQFEEEWPDFMVPVEETLKFSENTKTGKEEISGRFDIHEIFDISKLTTIKIGIGVGVAVLILGGLILLIGRRR